MGPVDGTDSLKPVNHAVDIMMGASSCLKESKLLAERLTGKTMTSAAQTSALHLFPLLSSLVLCSIKVKSCKLNTSVQSL